MQTSIEATCLQDWGKSFSAFAATTAGDVYCSDEWWRALVADRKRLAPISKGGHYQNLAVADCKRPV